MSLKKRPEPPKNFAPDEAQQWFKLLNLISDRLGDTGFSNTLFVDQVQGDDDTAQRGSLAFKYETIQAALDAALEGDVIWVSPGNYTEDLNWPDTDGLTLRGCGTLSTVVTANTTDLTVLTIAPTVHLTLATIRDMAIVGNGTGYSVEVDGSADADMFDGQFVIERVFADSDIRLQVVNNMRFNTILMAEADMRLTNCGGGTILGSTFDLLYVLYQAAPAVAPTSGPVFLAASTTVANVLNVQGLSLVSFGKDTQIGEVAASIVDNAAGCGFVQASGKIPGLDILGVVRSIDVEFTLTNDSHEVCRFDYAEIGGRVTIGDAAGGGTERGTPSIRNAMLYDTDGPHTFGDLTDVDLRESAFSQNSLVVNDAATVDRTRWIQIIPEGRSGTPVAWANGTNAVPYPAARGPQHVTHECADVSEMPIAITTKSATQVAYTKGGVDAVEVVVCGFRDYA
jgi:hypothetical protein